MLRPLRHKADMLSMAAGLLMVREAGGYVTDLDGTDAMFAKGHIVAGNETLHRELLKVLKSAGKSQGAAP